MNVLHLNRFFYSGQTSYVFSLVREQQQMGINAHLVMDGSPSYKALSAYKDTLRTLHANIINPGDIQSLLRLTQDFQPHIIHAHSSLTFHLAYNLSQQLKIPYLVTCHGLGLNRQEYRLYLQEADAILCISPRVAKSLHCFSEKITIVPNGLDVDEYKPQGKSEPIKIALVFRADSGKQKVYDHFCKAADILDGVQFFVASNSKPNSKTAQFVGWPDDLPSLLATTDIVATSGRNAVEALATGNALLILGRTFQGLLTPDIATKHTAPDLSGLSGSDPCYKNIFYDLAKLTQNQIYLRQLQQFGRELAEKEFCNKTLTQRILGIYDRCIKAKK